jgi:Raf kinase inhibitor-like YbhB/YbcL family protein
MTSWRRIAVAALAIGAAASAGCASDGRELRAPAPGATAPTLPVSTSTPPTGPAAVDPGGGALQLLAAWADGQPIGVEYTCDGAAASPALSWDGVPGGTKELALTVVDVDAGGFVHWVVVNIDPGVVGIEEGQLPEGAVQGRNTAGDLGWTPPCPPAGDPPHAYVFTLYALSSSVTIDDAMAPTAAIDVIAGADGGAATLTATYRRA